MLAMPMQFVCCQENSIKKIRIGSLSLQPGASLYLAEELKFFADENIEPDFKLFASAQQVAMAVAGGEVDIGLTAFPAAVYNLAGYGKIKFLAGNSSEKPGWEGVAYIVSNEFWDKGLQTFGDLSKNSNPMRVGITEKGSSLHYAFNVIANKYQLTTNKIKYYPLHSFGEIRSALITSKIDIALLPGVIAHQISNSNRGHIIGWANETPWQVTGLLVSTKTLSHQPNLVERFLKVYQKSCNVYHDNLNMISPEDNLKKYQNEPDSELAKVVAGIVKFVKPILTAEEVIKHPIYIDYNCKLNLKSVSDQLKWYQSQNLVNNKLAIKDLIAKDALINDTVELTMEANYIK